jgi:hypothetical protein
MPAGGVRARTHLTFPATSGAKQVHQRRNEDAGAKTTDEATPKVAKVLKYELLIRGSWGSMRMGEQ